MNPFESDDQSEDLENNWKDEEVFALIQLWQDNLVEFSKPRRSLNTCKVIAISLQEITKRPIPRIAKEVQEKLTNLRRQYNANKKKYGLTGKRSPWRFYKAIHKFRSNIPLNDTPFRRQVSIFEKNPNSYLPSSLVAVSLEGAERSFDCIDDKMDTEAAILGAKRYNDVGQIEESNESRLVDCNDGYNDEYTAFADNVAWSLRNVKDRTMLCLAKYKINTILFEAEMGLLCYEGANIPTRVNPNQASQSHDHMASSCKENAQENNRII